MEITRRAFSRGIGSLAGGLAVPGGVNGQVASILPAESGLDDAYEKLLSEYIRIEEAAIAAGRASSLEAGAATWEGRQLEGFIAELDGRVDLKTSAQQIYSEFKERFRDAARRVRENLGEADGRAANGTESEDDAVVVPTDEQQRASAEGLVGPNNGDGRQGGVRDVPETAESNTDDASEEMRSVSAS